MSDREGVLETFSKGNPGLSVDLVQAWRFVALLSPSVPES